MAQRSDESFGQSGHKRDALTLALLLAGHPMLNVSFLSQEFVTASEVDVALANIGRGRSPHNQLPSTLAR